MDILVPFMQRTRSPFLVASVCVRVASPTTDAVFRGKNFWTWRIHSPPCTPRSCISLPSPGSCTTFLFSDNAQHDVLFLSGTDVSSFCWQGFFSRKAGTDPTRQGGAGQYSLEAMLQMPLHLPPGAQSTEQCQRFFGSSCSSGDSLGFFRKSSCPRPIDMYS